MRLSTSSDDRPPWLVSFCSISPLITTLLAQSFINTFCTSGNIAYRSRKAGGPLSRGTRHILWLNQPLPSHALLPDIHFSPHSIIIKVTSLFQWPPQRISSLGLLAVARWYVSSLDRFALPPPQSALTTPRATNRSGEYGLRFSYIRCSPQVQTQFHFIVAYTERHTDFSDRDSVARNTVPYGYPKCPAHRARCVFDSTASIRGRMSN